MVRRRTPSDMPPDIPGVLAGLAACRRLMLNVQFHVKPTGACFYGAAMVLAALDAFAALLTGQRYYLATRENRGFMVPKAVDPDVVYDVKDPTADGGLDADGRRRVPASSGPRS